MTEIKNMTKREILAEILTVRGISFGTKLINDTVNSMSVETVMLSLKHFLQNKQLSHLVDLCENQGLTPAQYNTLRGGILAGAVANVGPLPMV